MDIVAKEASGISQNSSDKQNNLSINMSSYIWVYKITIFFF